MFKRLLTLANILASDHQVRTQLWYVPVLGFAMALMMGRLIWLAGWLSVEAFAALAFGLLISSGVCMLGAMGLYPLYQRDLPSMLMRGQEMMGRRLLFQSSVAATACFLALIPLIMLGPLVSTYGAEIWAAGLLHGLSQQLFLVATVDSRSRGKPLVFASDNLYRALAAVIVVLPVVAYSGSAALVLLAEALASLAFSILALRRTLSRQLDEFSVHVVDALKNMRSLPWKNAIHLLTGSLFAYSLINIDRWLASLWLTKPAFAQYAFIGVGLLVAQSLQSLVNAAVFTVVARRKVTNGNEAAYRFASQLSVASLSIGFIAGPASIFGLTPVIDEWFPQYGAGWSLAWPICALAVLRLSDFYSTFLIVSGNETILTRINAGVLLIALVVAGMLSHFRPIIGVEPILLVAALALSLGTVHYLALWFLSRQSRGESSITTVAD